MRDHIVRLAQKVFWAYLTHNFIVTNSNQIRAVAPTISCTLLRITERNCSAVTDFREPARIAEYVAKVAKGELGFYAMHDGKAVGSMWATINTTARPIVARRYIRLRPGEAILHDAVTATVCRGMAIAPFLFRSIAHELFSAFHVKRIIGDVNTRNTSALRYIKKLGLYPSETKLYFSILGRWAFEIPLTRLPAALDPERIRTRPAA